MNNKIRLALIDILLKGRFKRYDTMTQGCQYHSYKRILKETDDYENFIVVDISKHKGVYNVSISIKSYDKNLGTFDRLMPTVFCSTDIFYVIKVIADALEKFSD